MSDLKTAALEYHAQPRPGKLSVELTKPTATARDLALAYSPGVAEPVREIARDLGLAVNAGHDLTVANLPALVARIPDLAEVSIGHGLTADALEYGMAETVRRFCRACGQDI